MQITPSNICVELNDSIVKALVGKSSSNISVTEKHKSKRKDAVVSNLNVQGATVDGTPLAEHDRDVLGVIVNEQVFGNHYTTVNIIVKSVKKLMGTVVDLTDVNDSLKKLKYTDKDVNEIPFKLENLLSASVFDAKVNGQPVEDVIYFNDSCPLFDIANLKDQVIRYPHELLNVPNQNNTPLVITLKKYVLRRICEIKLHKNLAPTITFDDFFKRCRLSKVSCDQEHNARKTIIKFLEHLKSQNFITDFEVKKRGNVRLVTC